MEVDVRRWLVGEDIKCEQIYGDNLVFIHINRYTNWEQLEEYIKYLFSNGYEVVRIKAEFSKYHVNVDPDDIFGSIEKAFRL